MGTMIERIPVPKVRPYERAVSFQARTMMSRIPLSCHNHLTCQVYNRVGNYTLN